MKKCPSSIRCWDSEPLDQGVSRPVLLLLARNALAYTKCWLTDLGSFVDGPCKWIFGCLNNAFAQLHNLSLSVFFLSLSFTFTKDTLFLFWSHCPSFLSFPVLPDLAKFWHFGKIMKVFGTFLGLFAIGQNFPTYLFDIKIAIGQILIAANGQTLNK